MAAYGMHLGTAFQLVDDVLDYSADSEELGKNIGDDLAEGKPTLPLIIALQRAEKTDGAVIRHAIENGGLEQIEQIMTTIRSTDALGYTMERAQQEAELAVQSLAAFEDSEHKQALETLAWFSVERGH